MPISFGRKSKVKTGIDALLVPLHPDCRLVAQANSRLIDVRSPEAFRVGFIPGSYNVPDLQSMASARRGGLFQNRQVYLLADDIEQLQLYTESPTPEVVSPHVMGWFGPDAIDEWQKMNSDIGTLEAIDSYAVSFRVAALNALVLDIFDRGEVRPLSHLSALRFEIDDLPRELEGLPPETSICVTAHTNGLASYAASLVWNFGLRKTAYLSGGCGSQL